MFALWATDCETGDREGLPLRSFKRRREHPNADRDAHHLATEEQLQPRRRQVRQAAPAPTKTRAVGPDGAHAPTQRCVASLPLGALGMRLRRADDFELVRGLGVVVMHFSVLKSNQQGLATPLVVVNRDNNTLATLRMEDGTAGREPL